MSYRLQDVPNFLLYEGLAYIIRHSHSPEYTGTFYRRTYAGEERIFATRKEIEQELERRKQIADKLGVPLELLELNRYFDDEGRK